MRFVTHNLPRPARSHWAAGKAVAAEDLAHQALEQTSALPRDQEVLRHLSICHTELAAILMGRGRYREAREHYEQSLAIQNESDDTRGRAVVSSHLGTLALAQQDFPEAMRRYQDALTAFDNLGERYAVAICHNQLGVLLERQRGWGAAERHYRQAAELKIRLSDEAGAAETWCNVANVCWRQGRNAQAEPSFR